MRNLVTLHGLERLRRVVLGHKEHLGEPLPLVTGSRSADSPFDIVGLPFVHDRLSSIRAIANGPFWVAACRDGGEACAGVRDGSLNLLKDRPHGEAASPPATR